MKRTLAMVYGILVYVFFLGVTVYAIGFFANTVALKTIDTGAVAPLGLAIIVDLALLALFAAQHTIMARESFKHWWKAFVPRPIERSTYVLFASLALALIFWQWRPLPTVVWDVTNQIGRTALWVIYGLGWALVLMATFAVSHFDLFGLRQAWLYLQGKAYTFPPFRITGLYRLVRHPLMTGFLMVFWITPAMTVGHALFAIASTLYILMGIRLEEHDLERVLGDVYRAYRRKAPMLIPWPMRRSTEPV